MVPMHTTMQNITININKMSTSQLSVVTTPTLALPRVPGVVITKTSDAPRCENVGILTARCLVFSAYCFFYQIALILCRLKSLVTGQFVYLLVTSNAESVLWAFARYVEVWVAHAPGMPGTFFSSPQDSVPWCMPGSVTNGFFWSRWRGKSSRHSRCMRNPQFYVSGKRPMR